MHWLSILGIGLASNLDNLGIGFSFGTRRIKIPIRSNLLIAALSTLSAYIAIRCGHLIATYTSPTFANTIGGSMIMAIGLWAIIKSLMAANRRKASNAQKSYKADHDGDVIITWKETWTLGIALSLNCIASGLGAGVTGVSAWGTTISVGAFSIITIAMGSRLGHQISNTVVGKYSNAIGGIILIGIGIYEIII
ncbi:manganese efflux pump [Paenibacillus sp. JDR-2]|uniref:manganese efflux pump n=1 Tax=Paenibacillus sp. (strain JDR-2) TaxID=324057 RepID=UPI00016679DB|nr:manganese efflux pump [Paenibacillus sp. JDR-2]ACT02325.1 protein of unknown function DUF204 [Paenibacillus sp. JDR-2]